MKILQNIININKSNKKNKLKVSDKNIKIIKLVMLISKIYCLVSLPYVTFLIFFNESRFVNIFAFVTLIVNTLNAIDTHYLELDISEYEKEKRK